MNINDLILASIKEMNRVVTDEQYENLFSIYQRIQTLCELVSGNKEIVVLSGLGLLLQQQTDELEQILQNLETITVSEDYI